ncbi:ubiquitin-conjugating enzyme/RWD-like protein [Clohesyomyces aquaticus]|uniref:Ubiquitin-conjugating enzyme/RWD-like protein n=1 Tax=Clohesyomyces aquaticus TaxID=1231657 RepID=A0A1Y1ZFU6_9PLEO|nr:ubiquitin-conjugating enzyme/RWD-like protein [Clohesyomyces aquaticus]
MNSKSIRRLAADHGSLQRDGLPPNYLFPSSSANDPSSDLTSLDVLLAGPPGTPYAAGVWRLHLDIPPTYPTAPPTATFRTRLWHPNIDESSGAVCVETLKRDWVSTLKLRDVLVTISCLLIQPNPASALNEAAGKLASEDWDGFCRRARLMTGIHAAIPRDLIEEVREAQMRGEEKQDVEMERVDKKVEEGRANAKGKGKDSVRAVPSVSATPSKIRASLPVEDEENTRRRGDTVEPESDPESDWIPGPLKSPKPFPAGRNNIFGIKGLDDSMQMDSPRKKKVSTTGQKLSIEEDNDDSDPFILVPSKRPAHQQYQTAFHVPQASSSKLAIVENKSTSTTTPDLLKFSHKTPFSATQPNNQTHPLLKEFSWTWQESEIMHDTGTFGKMDSEGALVPTKMELRKRIAGEEFEERRKWEMKRFKRTGWDLQRYNKGDFGAKTGVGRL